MKSLGARIHGRAHQFAGAALVAILASGCSGAVQRPVIVYVTAEPTAATFAHSSAAIATDVQTPAPAPTFALMPNVTFGPAAWGKPWRDLAGKGDPKDPWKTINNLQPPDGVYVLDWLAGGTNCGAMLWKDDGGALWGFETTGSPASGGLSLADLVGARRRPRHVSFSTTSSATRPLTVARRRLDGDTRHQCTWLTASNPAARASASAALTASSRSRKSR
jgi:hypothetical protein